MKLPIVNRCQDPFLTIGQILGLKQPTVAEQIQQVWHVAFEDEELTPFQRHLDKLMRQRPRPGKGGV